MDGEFKALIDTLLNSPNDGDRAKAARTLGDYVHELTDEEYEAAKKALDKAMQDSNPMVLMAAMGSMPKFNRKVGEGDMVLHGDDKDEILAQRAVCSVCGKPEALIDAGGCERDDCPYQ